eukprot:400970-Rhodomonas_salina.2
MSRVDLMQFLALTQAVAVRCASVMIYVRCCGEDIRLDVVVERCESGGCDRGTMRGGWDSETHPLLAILAPRPFRTACIHAWIACLSTPASVSPPSWPPTAPDRPKANVGTRHAKNTVGQYRTSCSNCIGG